MFVVAAPLSDRMQAGIFDWHSELDDVQSFANSFTASWTSCASLTSRSPFSIHTTDSRFAFRAISKQHHGSFALAGAPPPDGVDLLLGGPTEASLAGHAQKQRGKVRGARKIPKVTKTSVIIDEKSLFFWILYKSIFSGRVPRWGILDHFGVIWHFWSVSRSF